MRVYSLTSIPATGRESIYACLVRRGAPVALERPSRFRAHSLTHIALAGTIVAYADYQHGVDSGCTGITVLDVATKRTLLALPEVGCTVDAGFVSLGQVTDLVVNSRGSVAWIISKGSIRSERFEVHSAEGSAATALLDAGPGIVPRSLRLSGGAISWQDGARRLSAVLH